MLEGGMKLKLKKLTIASVFADFVAGGGQWWPLNVSVGWGERTSYVRGGSTMIIKYERANA